jgi:hypothetical protein
MIPYVDFTPLYFILLSVVIVLSILPLFLKSRLNQFPKINLIVGTFLIITIVILFIGLRNPYDVLNYYGDTSKYTSMYYEINHSQYFVINSDVGFFYFMKLCSKYFSVTVFYFFCALLYVLPVYYSFKKWFNEYAFFTLILFVSSMSFWSFGVNGVRNGIATSLLILALNYKKNNALFFVICLLSFSFHSSVLLPIAAILITNYYTNTKRLIIFWISCVILTFFFYGQIEQYFSEFFITNDVLGNRRAQGYFQDEIDGEIIEKSFRIDFIIYSMFPIILGYFFIVKKNYQNSFYKQLVNTYIISNAVWVLLIYTAFTNRTAYLSWFLMPIILIYPLLKEKLLVNQNRFIAILILGSLLFTLIITFK